MEPPAIFFNDVGAPYRLRVLGHRVPEDQVLVGSASRLEDQKYMHWRIRDAERPDSRLDGRPGCSEIRTNGTESHR